MVPPPGLKRRLKRLWQQWLRVPIIVGFSSSLITFVVLTCISEYATRREQQKRTAALREWPEHQSIWANNYLDFQNPSTFSLSPSLDPEMPNSFCGPEDIMIILVATSPNNLKARKAIRDTWGSPQNLEERGVKIAFVMGRSNRPSVQRLLQMEAKEYKDIVQENFLDTYYNRTLKTLTMLKWLSLSCPHWHRHRQIGETHFPARWVLKTNDDTFMNVDRMLDIARSMPYSVLIGSRRCGVRPEWDTNSTLYMPKYLYKWSVYPGYLQGNAYLIHGSIIADLIENVDASPLIHLEDIYTTGILARRTYYFPDDSQYISSEAFNPEMDICEMKIMASLNEVTPEETREIWNDLNSPEAKKCKAIKLKRKPGGGRYLTMTAAERKLCLIPKAKQKFFDDDENPEVYDGYGYDVVF